MTTNPKFWQVPPFLPKETLLDHDKRSQDSYKQFKGDSEERFRAQLAKSTPIERDWFNGITMSVLVFSACQTDKLSCLSCNDWCYHFEFKGRPAYSSTPPMESAEVNFGLWQST